MTFVETFAFFALFPKYFFLYKIAPNSCISQKGDRCFSSIYLSKIRYLSVRFPESEVLFHK